jgi:hypothetical protein
MRPDWIDYCQIFYPSAYRAGGYNGTTTAYRNRKESHRRADETETEQETFAHRTFSLFLKSEDVPPERFAPQTTGHFSFFGFHSRAIFYACSTRVGVIMEGVATRTATGANFPMCHHVDEDCIHPECISRGDSRQSSSEM